MKVQWRPNGFIQQLLSSSKIGSKQWWHNVKKIGTPIVEEKTQQQAEVLFLWQDPQGNQQNSKIHKVYIDINGITDHHSFQPESLQRIPNTDVWYWSTLLDKRWQGSYSLIPVTHAELPFAFENTQQQHHWWCSIYPNAIADPLNKLTEDLQTTVRSFSALHMPYAHDQTIWYVATHPESSPLPLNWHSQRLGNSRTIWLYQTKKHDIFPDTQHQISYFPNSYTRPLIILLDGQTWVKKMPIFAVLDVMTKQNKLPPATWLFIDAINAHYRQQELPCNSDFWLAVQMELLPLCQQYVQFSENPQQTVVAGQSYGGLAALYAGLYWPERFGCVVSQSGSFWWPHRDMVNFSSPPDKLKMGWLTQQIIKQGKSRYPLKIFQEAGRYEPDILYVNKQIKIALKKAGHCVNYRVFAGGHDVLCWRGGLIEGLCWVLSKNQ